MGSLLLITVFQSVVPVSGFFPTGPTLDSRWRLLEATPRLSGTSGFGTAVVFGRTEDAILVLTAEHVVRRGSDFKLEFFERKTYPKVARTILYGTIVKDLAIPDFAIVKFPVVDPTSVPLCRIATLQERPKRLPEEGFSIGCTNGLPPTFEPTIITAKRLARKMNDSEVAFFWETEQIPIAGRSGGPLFDSAGRLIGICCATTSGKGFYTHTDEILVGLGSLKLEPVKP